MSPPNSPVLVASSPDPSSPTVLLAEMNLAESHRKPSTQMKAVRFVLPSPVECLAGKRRPFDEVDDLEEDDVMHVHVDHARFPPTASCCFKKPRI